MTIHQSRKNGIKTARKPDGTFGPGNPGKPKGARHKATLAALELLDGEAEALSRKAVELALEGDTTALRLCLERIAPPRKDAPVTFTLPKVETAADAARALGSVLDAVAAGQVTPAEASGIASLIEGFRRTLESEDLERRVERLEQAK